MSSEVLDIALLWVAETVAAYGVTEDDPDDPIIWLPKSQVKKTGGTRLGGAANFDVPERLALEKGLI